MAETMKVAVLTAPQTIMLETRSAPVPKPDEVLIKVRHAGICGSDLHYYEHGRIGTQKVQYPMVLGHEVGGEIAEIGSTVTGLQVGDLVAVEPQKTCGKCAFCKTGRYNLCPSVVFWATPPIDGAFSEYVTHPADMVYKLLEGMDTSEGALMEPLAIGFHVSNQAEAKTGESAIILGAGTIGLVTLLALKARGITEVYITDLVNYRLEMAKKLGARQVFNARNVDVPGTVSEMTGGRGVDIVFEMAGSSVTTQATVDLVKRGGRIVLVGYAQDVVRFDFRKLIMKEASIRTSRRYRNIYPVAMQAVSDGLISVKELVTDTYPFKDIARALKHAVTHKESTIKTIIEF